jgi:hypothetical protein
LLSDASLADQLGYRNTGFCLTQNMGNLHMSNLLFGEVTFLHLILSSFDTNLVKSLTLNLDQITGRRSLAGDPFNAAMTDVK